MADDEFHYESGFGNEFVTEAVEGALPVGRNSPQQAYARASAAELAPAKPDDTLAIMFESRWMILPTRQAMEAAHRQRDYDAVWSGLSRRFR